MKITVIYGQSHKGMTYAMTREVLNNLVSKEDEIKEFFLPEDGPDFCCGCVNCFLKGEEHCKAYDKVHPIAHAIEEADVVILNSPNYVMEMSGAMKNLMDHLAYRWMVHRPHGSMFTKVGITICSSAGAPAGHTVRSMAKQLKWMGIPKVYYFPFVSGAFGVADLTPQKREEFQRKAVMIAKKVHRKVEKPRSSLRNIFLFHICRKMQLSEKASWNPTDREWWVEQEWTKNVRPWNYNKTDLYGKKGI